MKGKKVLLFLAAMLMMTSVLVMNTFSSYQKSVTLAGSFEATFFYLVVDKSENTFIDVTIAPGETYVWPFTVSNQLGSNVSEMDMTVELVLTAGDCNGIPAIPVLTITLYETQGGTDIQLGQVDATTGGKGTMTVTYDLPANVGVTKSYKVVVTWPHTDNDIAYIHDKTALNLNVSAGGSGEIVPNYPLWDPNKAYFNGDHVTYQNKDFVARYWTEGDQPGLQTSPWDEITDQWRSFNVYTTGNEVWYNGVKYRAKWYSFNKQPDISTAWIPV